MRILIINGSPEPSSPALVARLAGAADVVVAVDRGLSHARAAGVVPDHLVGDDDTCLPNDLAWAAAAGLVHEASPRAKDDTDLALAIGLARELGAGAGEPVELTLTCACGGRADHALVVFGVLAAHADLCPRVVEDGFECRVLAPGAAQSWGLGEEAVGHLLSVVALAPATLSEEGMRWNLDHATSAPLADVGLANEVLSPDARVTCHEGALAVFLMDELAGGRYE